MSVLCFLRRYHDATDTFRGRTHMGVKQRVTAEELWTMPEVPGKRFEIVNGKLREVPGTGAVHSWIVGTVYRLPFDFVTRRKLGRVFPDGVSYVMRRDPDQLRIPDVSFVATQHLSDRSMPEGYWLQAPDLAIEVVSPEDRAAELDEKAIDYLEAGVQQVWILWPHRQAVSVRMPRNVTKEFGPDDELDGGDLLPGFRVRVGDLFDLE